MEQVRRWVQVSTSQPRTIEPSSSGTATAVTVGDSWKNAPPTKVVTVPWLRATPRSAVAPGCNCASDGAQRLLGIDARRGKGSGRDRCEVIDQLHHAAGRSTAALA